MIREYEIEEGSIVSYTMAFIVYVKMTDTRYGSEKTMVAQFGLKEDAELFITTRMELEKKQDNA